MGQICKPISNVILEIDPPSSLGLASLTVVIATENLSQSRAITFPFANQLEKRSHVGQLLADPLPMTPAHPPLSFSIPYLDQLPQVRNSPPQKSLYFIIYDDIPIFSYAANHHALNLDTKVAAYYLLSAYADLTELPNGTKRPRGLIGYMFESADPQELIRVSSLIETAAMKYPQNSLELSKPVYEKMKELLKEYQVAIFDIITKNNTKKRPL